MGKTSKWLRSILTGKKSEKDKISPSKPKPKPRLRPTDSNSDTTITANKDSIITVVTTAATPTKEKRRWSFRRSSAAAPAPPSSAESNAAATNSAVDGENFDEEEEKKKHAMAVAAATAAAADAAVAAAQAAAAVIRLTGAAGSNNGLARSFEEAAAVKIQSVFRSYLARKALCALRGLVKLQALVRGHLVRKQAKATLRCMQALVTAQARARAQRIRMVSEDNTNQRQSTSRKATEEEEEDLFSHIYDEMDNMNVEENIKIVEMDVCETKCETRRRKNNTNHHHHHHHNRVSTYNNEESFNKVSPAPSVLTDMSPKAHSGHFLEDSTSYTTAQSSPQYYYSAISSRPNEPKSSVPFTFPKPPYAESVMSYDYPLFPNYMANTESSRAKARSQSAPKQRPADYAPSSFERQSSRRRASVEGRNVPRPVKMMQRSASHVGPAAQNYQYPNWSGVGVKLDKSSASLKDSECGSTSTVLTNANYCRSLVGYDPRGERYY